ncbi:hypothetical protein [Lentzea flaviverrucosa]|uniref:Uncharacterized protein n=1 Tax=Lentzea flaviverrucosa TaxID=200379 RepID=A0A1H9XXE6_9PSEU|nr:hypothetical protein [Lentzea flaviverrucosa]RDI17117.1 hypothetical protein DFR72_12280 [Lentzea flaviverrucosa]SES50811.1 hypothetical protein SAMN05216195_12249 [Lentzea flaviverrucosa]
MSTPEPDRVTAESELEDADIGSEHTRPTYADENPGGPHRGRDESEPHDEGGMDQRSL